MQGYPCRPSLLLPGCWALAMILCLSPARAALTISNAPSRNVLCSSGVCTATAKNAVLKIQDLKSMLALSAVTVSAGREAQDIFVGDTLDWEGATSLTLDATANLQIAARVTVAAGQGISFVTYGGNAGEPVGAFSFSNGGRVRFTDVSASLTINGQSYGLVSSLPALAAAIAANPSGTFALADGYNSFQGDGAFTETVVPTPFGGKFEGLGNTIEALHVESAEGNGALFASLLAGGVIENLDLSDAYIVGNLEAAVVVLGNAGTLAGIAVGGRVKTSSYSNAAGLAAESSSTIAFCSSSAEIKPGGHAFAGGLVAVLDNGGTISQSFSTGLIYASGGSKKRRGGAVGGFVGYDAGNITNSYSNATMNGALLNVPVEAYSAVGGLVGYLTTLVTSSYASGTLQTYQGTKTGYPAFGAGAFAGSAPVVDPSLCGACYWDTDTANFAYGVRHGNVPTVVGLSNAQFTSGLPAGFDPAIWAEAPGINNGLPYLIRNPPAP